MLVEPLLGHSRGEQQDRGCGRASGAPQRHGREHERGRRLERGLRAVLRRIRFQRRQPAARHDDSGSNGRDPLSPRPPQPDGRGRSREEQVSEPEAHPPGWLDADLLVFDDSGLGLSNPTDPTTYNEIRTEWKFDQFIPDSCTECQSGQQTAIIGWGLKNDDTLKVSGFSSYGDGVIGTYFLKMSAADFKKLLLDKTGLVHDAFPDRFERFFIEGMQHTSLIAGFDTTKVGTLTIAGFTRAMVDGTADWVDTLENGGK